MVQGGATVSTEARNGNGGIGFFLVAQVVTGTQQYTVLV